MAKSLVKTKIEGDSLEASRERVEAFKKAHLCFFWEPYPWQERLLKAVHEKNTVAAISSNKIGKCITYQTLISTPNGDIPVGKLYEDGKPFQVYAWDGTKKVVTEALPPFKKEGLHKCYRVTMSDGRWFEAADYHRVLLRDGSYSSILDVLHTYYPSHSASSLDIYQKVHVLDGRNLIGTGLGCQDGCLVDCGLYDEQLLPSQDNVLSSVPLLDGSLAHNPSLLRLDVLGRKYRHILSELTCLPYKLRRFVGQLFVSLGEISYTSYLLLTNALREFQPLCATAFSGLPLNTEVVPRASYKVRSCSPPLFFDGTEIISSNYIGCQEVYDFTVPKYHNYCAGGMVHHNTAAVVNILISWLLGYEPWTQGYTGEDFVEEGGQRYRKSSLGIKPPVNLMLTGEDWKSHIGRSLVPEFKKWLPDGWYTTKKNEQGVDYYFEMFNKSTVTVMSYSQDDALFESFRIQGVLMDEPPPKSKYTAMSRGLMLDQGKTLLSLTPLKEAWILDEIVLSGRKDIAIVDNLSIIDNPDLYQGDMDNLHLMGLNDLQCRDFFDLLLYENVQKKTPVVDKGRGAEKFLESLVPLERQSEIGKLKILKFIKDIDPSDVPPRVFGQFKSLVGRVLKEFDSNIHIVKSFDVPTDWPVIAMIDFHLSTPQMISFWAVNRQDIHFNIGEVWKNINGDEVADAIIKSKMRYGWYIEDAYIDPLSKGDVAYLKNRMGSDLKDTFSIIEEKLLTHGITLHVASKDKESGIKNLQTMLKGVNSLPTLYIFEECERFRFEVNRWVFDENGKPIKENDHAMENAYRYTLTGNKYEDHVISPLHYQEVRGSDAWMSA